jgi:nicotinamidase-related amidase
MKTLVVIDMQTSFVGNIYTIERRRQLISTIAKLCEDFVELDWPIITVEFTTNKYGETTHDIMEIVECHSRWIPCEKHECNGGHEINQILKDNDWPEDLVVVGIYGDQCVAETVDELANRINGSIQIPTDAVWPKFEPVDHDGEKYWFKTPNYKHCTVYYEKNTADIIGVKNA